MSVLLEESEFLVIYYLENGILSKIQEIITGNGGRYIPLARASSLDAIKVGVVEAINATERDMEGRRHQISQSCFSPSAPQESAVLQQRIVKSACKVLAERYTRFRFSIALVESLNLAT